MKEQVTSITDLLGQIAAGKENAKDQLFEAIYPKLREMAEFQMQSQRAGHTLQPTALVNEAARKMLDGDSLERANNRYTLIATAALAMRSVLVDHARSRAASKRPTGNNRERHPLDDSVAAFEESEQIDLLALDDALQQLRTMSQRQHDIVTLHFFGGMRLREVAEHLDVSLSTVEKDWGFARAWLRTKLESD